MEENFLHKLITSGTDAMRTNDINWPEDWDMNMKLKFLDDAIEYLENTHELYEYCTILKDVKKEIQS